MKRILVVLLLSVSGCSHTTTTLVNPGGQIVTCSTGLIIGGATPYDGYEHKRLCIEKYKESGYKEVER